MKVKFVFVLLVGALLMSSCAGKRELVTYWKPDLKPEELKVSGYDFETKLRWTSSNDAEYLYFDIECSDPVMQQSLLRGGLTVYLDTTVRKREYVYFRYPLMRTGRQQSNGRQRGSRQVGNPIERGISQEMIARLNMSPVYWQAGEKWRLEDPMSDSSAFESGVKMDSTNTLFLHVGVPLEALHPKGLDGLDRLSVGFSMQGRMRTPGMSGQRQGGQQMSAGRSGGGGGRGGSGGRGGGGGRGGSMGGMQGQGMGAAGPSSISFWFVTTLARK